MIVREKDREGRVRWRNPLINHTFSTGETFTLQKIHSFIHVKRVKLREKKKVLKSHWMNRIGGIEVKKKNFGKFVCAQRYKSFNWDHMKFFLTSLLPHDEMECWIFFFTFWTFHMMCVFFPPSFCKHGFSCLNELLKYMNENRNRNEMKWNDVGMTTKFSNLHESNFLLNFYICRALSCTPFGRMDGWRRWNWKKKQIELWLIEWPQNSCDMFLSRLQLSTWIVGDVFTSMWNFFPAWMFQSC